MHQVGPEEDTAAETAEDAQDLFTFAAFLVHFFRHLQRQQNEYYLVGEQTEHAESFYFPSRQRHRFCWAQQARPAVTDVRQERLNQTGRLP